MHQNNIPNTIPSYLERSLRTYSDRPFLSFTDESPFTYSQAEQEILNIRKLLEFHNIQKEDKVAILAGNMPNWAIVYFAVVSMGAVVVPVLPDFSPEEVCNILTHSDAKVLFVSELQHPKIDGFCAADLILMVRLNDFQILHSVKGKDPDFSSHDPAEFPVHEHDLAAIIYTSGTTGNSKGVMLTHKNIISNTIAASILQPIKPEDRFLSLLPMSHTYENTLGLMLPMISGASVYYLKKLPTPNVLVAAMAIVRPTIMLAVPLIIEKIYRNKIMPAIHGKILTRTLYKIPVLRKVLNKAAGKKLMQTFGGELRFFGIGGSKLDAVVERFLLEAGFPYAIGYGLTETSPLLAGVNPQMVRWQSTGPAVTGVELKLINVNTQSGEGEIVAKGPNVMQGYYKNPEATNEVFTDDGWFKTGDLAIMDKDGFVFIKGRLKNVIIGPSGENIYPEEIESLINNFDFVAESLVIEQKGKLVAYVHFNMEALQEKYNNMKSEVSDYLDEKINELREELITYVNTRVSSFANIKTVVIHNEPFEKTPTQKIKRYKYLS
jgi:long-chain acyl-CoA synthetase